MRQPPPSGRLLIVDGDPSALNALAETIRRRLPSVIVDTALSGHAAVRQCAAADYDALVCDSQLPDLHGTALLSALAQHRRNASVILVGKQVSGDLVIRAGLHGIHHVLAKPIEHNHLIATLLHVLAQRMTSRDVDKLRRQVERQRRRVKKALAHARLRLESHEHLLTRRREALAGAEAREAALLAALEGVSEAMLVVDRGWNIMAANERARRHIFGGRPFDSLDHRQSLWSVCAEWSGSVLELECRRALEEQVSLQCQMLLPQDGRWYAVRAAPSPHGLALYFRDLTSGERQNDRETAVAVPAVPPATEETHVSNGHNVASSANGHRPATSTPPWAGGDVTPASSASIREAERARISRELQDEFGPQFAALHADLSWLDGHISQEQLPVLLKIRFMAHVVTQLTDALARLTGGLRPAILDELGLAAALQWQASTFEHRTGIRCTVTAKDIDHLDDGLGTTVFRIVHEFLSLLNLPTRPTAATMTITGTRTHLTLELKHDGRTAAHASVESIPGLRRLKQRVHSVGGTVVAANVPDHGATIVATIPLLHATQP